MSLTKIEKDVIIELYKEFHEDNPSESCTLCCHSFVNKEGLYLCGIGNFHQCCGGTNCKEFELSCLVEALFEKIKEYKTRIKEIGEFNKSELFKKLHKEFPELYENEVKQMKDIKDKSEVIGKLTDAKELLKKWVSLLGFKAGKLAEQTEQFLSEVENV